MSEAFFSNKGFNIIKISPVGGKKCFWQGNANNKDFLIRYLMMQCSQRETERHRDRLRERERERERERAMS